MPAAPSDLEKQEREAKPTTTFDLSNQERGAGGRTGVPMVARTLSIRSLREAAPPGAWVPVQFRTLSIQVTSLEAKNAPLPQQLGSRKRKGKQGAATDLASLDWHTIPVAKVFERLSASHIGLEDPQVARRRSTYGSNKITPPPTNMFKKVAEWIFGGFGTLLLAASVVCFIAWKPLGDPPVAANLALAVVLLLVLLLQAVFNAWQDFSTSRVMGSIKNLLPTTVTVIRNGGQINLRAEQLVPGDLVVIGMGMKVPADLRIIECTGDCTFDRSILTGESEPVAATVESTHESFLESKNIALQGTHCTSGSGQAIVIQTGDLTVFGRIAALSARTNTHLTTLQREILRFVLIIASLAATVAVIIVILWAAWLRIKFPSYINVPNLLIDIVSVMVAFIPEGLPICVTLSLAKIASTLSKHKVLCKSLSIVETLGAVTVICSDKTGTLTQNRMHVQQLAILDSEFDPSDLRARIDGQSTAVQADDGTRKNLTQFPAVACICNAATFSPKGESKEVEILGDATDSALLSFSESIKPVEDVRNCWKEVHKVNFNSKTKYMLKLSQLAPEFNSVQPLPSPIAAYDDFAADDYLMTVKGAPEILFPRCSFIISPTSGEVLSLTAERYKIVVATQEKWAAQGQRVILLARKVIKSGDIPPSALKNSQILADIVDNLTEDLTIVGLVGLIDPLKEDIVETVRVCRGAGIRFFVVTGDHPATAVAIAASAGIVTSPSTIHRYDDLDPDVPKTSIMPYEPVAEEDDDPRPMRSIVISGTDMLKFSGTQWDQLCMYDEIVFARTTPEQKLSIVKAFQQRQCIVAMTGDGVNDSASLKAADIGIAMGSGSDIAREAADMVLLDSFGSIVVALEYGRLVYDNLKKSCLYLLPAGSFSELMPVVFNILLGVPQMLSSLQMIIICVATDLAPALSLCMEGPEEGLLRRKPRNVKTDRLVDGRFLLHAYGYLGILESLCAMALSFWYLQRNGIPFSSLVFGFGDWPLLDKDPDQLNRAQSVYFFTLVIMQWGNLLSTRTRRLSIFTHTPLKNPWLLPAMACALVVAIFFSYVPFFKDVFLTRPVAVEHYFIPIAFAAALVILDEIRKYMVRRYPKGILARLAW